jgi:DNA polymerase-4
VVTPALLRTTLGYLADRIGGRLRSAGQAGRTITVRVRFADLRSVTRSLTLPAGVSATLTLTEVAIALAEAALADHRDEHEITLLAISASQLVEQSVLQLELPLEGSSDRHRPGTPAGAARWVADRSVDLIRTRFGRDAIGYASVKFAGVGHAPDAFRELAEHQLPRDN